MKTSTDIQSSLIIHPDELSRTWIDRLSDAGIKTIGIHPCGGKTAYQSLENLVEQCKTQEYRDLIDYAKSRGLEIEYEIHAMEYLLKRDLFDAHPEYFRMNRNGDRTNDSNFCVSNAEALELVAKTAAQLAKSLYGSSQNFYFWLGDGDDLRCHCPLCEGIPASDQQMLVLNRMLSEIQKDLPQAKMAYLAYKDSIVPPAQVRPMDGIFLEYAPFEKYTAKGEDAAQRIQKEREMLIPLMHFFDREPQKVLEYWYDNSLFSNWKKPPKKFVLNDDGMRSDIDEYQKMGFRAISSFACFLGADYEELHGDVDVLPFADAVLNREEEK